LPLAVLVLGVLTLAKLGFLNCTTGRFATGCFGVRPILFIVFHTILLFV
jgi:hypothetical protein